MAATHLVAEPPHRRRWVRRRRPLDETRRSALRQTFANELATGSPLPAFALTDPRGRVWTPRDFERCRGLLVAFLSNRCPFVLRMRNELTDFARVLQRAGVGVLAINANDAQAHLEEGPIATARAARSLGLAFPYLRDDTQETARAFAAACTPDLFLYGADRTLFYHGQFDSARPNNDLPVTGEHLKCAVERLLAGRPAPEIQHPSSGCAIRWKPGR